MDSASRSTSGVVAVSQSGRRETLLRGRASFVADILPPGCLHAAFVRSPVAAAQIVSVETTRALAYAGVVGAYTGQQIATEIAAIRIDGPGLSAHDWYPLATDRVRFQGEALAVIVGTDPYTVEDAVDLVDIDYRPEPVVASVQDALSPGASLVHESLESNVLFHTIRQSEGFDEAFSEADIVIERVFRQARQTPAPLETRGVLAEADLASGRIVVVTSTQIPHIVRTVIAKMLKRPESSIRVVTPNVGGGFGLKARVYGEEVVLPWLAERHGVPVRWVEDRRENLLASSHAHDDEFTVRVAADRSGRLKAADIRVVTDVGAFSIYPQSASLQPATGGPSVLACYRIPAIRLEATAVATNKCPVAPYRGVSAPMATFVGERMLDLLADQLQLDRVKVREINLIRSSEMPYTTPLGVSYDSGDYSSVLERVLSSVDYESWMVERSRRRTSGLPLIGVGMAVFNEHSAPGSLAFKKRGITTIPGFDTTRVAIDASGRVTVYVSSADAGQDHATSYAMTVAAILHIESEDVTIVEGDTDRCPIGTGTFASRWGTAQLSATVTAAQQLESRLRSVAAEILNSALADIRHDSGGFHTIERDVVATLPEVAQSAYSWSGDKNFVLEETATWDGVPTYPYGAQASIVELDTNTFDVRILRQSAVEDCGTRINEVAVDQQMIGAIAMGVGNVLLEELVYTPDGQLMSASLMDYLLPSAMEVPHISISHLVTTTDRTPLGSKGVGEAGTIGAVASIGVAVADAMSQLGYEVNDLPVGPGRLFATINSGSSVLLT